MEFLFGIITGAIITLAMWHFWPQEKQIAITEYNKLKDRVAFLERKYGL